MIKSIYHCLPMWVWELGVVASYIGLFIMSVLVVITVIGGEDDE